jgi:hypothetical protein
MVPPIDSEPDKRLWRPSSLYRPFEEDGCQRDTLIKAGNLDFARRRVKTAAGEYPPNSIVFR